MERAAGFWEFDASGLFVGTSVVSMLYISVDLLARHVIWAILSEFSSIPLDMYSIAFRFLLFTVWRSVGKLDYVPRWRNQCSLRESIKRIDWWNLRAGS